MNRDTLGSIENTTLSERLRKGERSAEKELFSLVEEIVVLVVGDNYQGPDLKADISDVIQETFIRVYKFISTTNKVDHNLGGLIRVVARGKWQDEKRKRSRYQKFLAVFNSRKQFIVEEESTREKFQTLKQFINLKLPKCYTILMLKYELNLSIKEISEFYNKSEGATKVQIHNCKKKIIHLQSKPQK